MDDVVVRSEATRGRLLYIYIYIWTTFCCRFVPAVLLTLSAKYPPSTADPHHPNCETDSKDFHLALSFLGTKSISMDSWSG